MRISRRQVLKMGSGLALGGGLSAALAAKKNVPIALQLYSLRDDCKADIVKVIAAVGKMGFQGVEFYGWGGYFGRSAKELRQLLDDQNLKPVSDHISPNMLEGDKLRSTVEFHQAMGTKILTLSSLAGSKQAQATAQFWKDSAKKVSELAARLKPYGMRLGFHNHPGEFTRLADGSLPWELFFDNASKDVLQQLDLGSVLRGGADPAVYLKRYRRRTPTLHMKDYAAGKDKVLIGEGDVKWKEIIKLAGSVGGIEWYIVEQESYPYPPLESVQRSFENLKKILGQKA